MNTSLVKMQGKNDGRGFLVALESQRNVPFDIKRVYYLTQLDARHPRGFHAHKNLKQLVVCLHGHCDFIIDDGSTRETIRLDSAQKGLLIESMIWREMHNFTPDCVIMVLASDYYDEDDYIRDYQEFKRTISDSSSK